MRAPETRASLKTMKGNTMTINRPTQTSKNRRSRAGQVKILLFTLAIAGTLGLWEVFSHQAQVTVAAAATTSANVPGLSLELPPLPELVPFDPGQGVSQTNGNSTSGVAAPTAPLGRILMGGSAPTFSFPQAMARTRSSR